MTLDDAIDAVQKILKTSEVTFDKNLSVLEINMASCPEPVGLNELRALCNVFDTEDIRIDYQSDTGDYYGGHNPSECAITIHGAKIEYEPPPEPKLFQKSKLSCSFCGKGQREVKKLIAGAAVYICNECVNLCKKICEEA